MKQTLFFLFFIFCFANICAQQINVPLGYSFNQLIDREISQKINHSSFKPLIKTSININIDSILEKEFGSIEKKFK